MSHGGRAEGEHITIGDWPVQFLPAADELEKEALENAVETAVDGVKTWVMTAEHLVAIALRTGRSKDHVRVLQFLESGTVDSAKLETVLNRHGLTGRWKQFTNRFLEERS